MSRKYEPLSDSRQEYGWRPNFYASLHLSFIFESLPAKLIMDLSTEYDQPAMPNA